MKIFPDYSYVDFLENVKTLKHLTKRRMEMMFLIEDDLKQRKLLQLRKQYDNFTLKTIYFLFLLYSECRSYRNLLKWSNILKLFCSGFKEKELDLKNYINHINMKNFSSKKEKSSSSNQTMLPNETDCCICFSCYTNEINPVVYCSGYFSPL